MSLLHLHVSLVVLPLHWPCTCLCALFIETLLVDLNQSQEKAKNEGRTPVVYAIDPLLAALAHFDTSADLR